MHQFNATKAANSHAGTFQDFSVYWYHATLHGLAGWYWQEDGKSAADGGPFETSQAAFLAAVEAFDSAVHAGVALG